MHGVNLQQTEVHCGFFQVIWQKFFGTTTFIYTQDAGYV